MAQQRAETGTGAGGAANDLRMISRR